MPSVTLPFKRSGAAQTPPATVGNEPPPSDVGGTANLDDKDELLTLPFDDSSDALNVQQYAKLCFECRQHPDREADLYASFGVEGSAARNALDKHWREKLASNPSERHVFEAAFNYLKSNT